MRLYVVGKVTPGNHVRWEFIGVFEDRERAEGLCANEYYFVGPVDLNALYEGETLEWIGAYYPKN